MKQLRYLVEGVLVYGFIALFSVLDVDRASGLGGWIGRALGPRLAANRKALRNLRLALPGKSDDEYRKILLEMWDNLGRTFAEYPHLETIARTRVTATGTDYLKTIVDNKTSCIFFTGHLANWETAAAYAHTMGLDLDLIYRAPNNPYVEGILQRCRSLHGKLVTYPKSSQGMRDIVSALKSGRNIGILIDQKYNQGLPMPFFGRTAMTSPAFVQLAQKFSSPLHPGRVERVEGARFRITIFPEIETKGRAVEDVIARSHALLEEWISDKPGQWLWLHRRWRENNEPDDAES